LDKTSELLMRRRLIIIICIVVSVVLFVCIFRTDFAGEIYNSVYRWLGKKSGINPYWPEVGTNKELWFNGYLGIFFRFDKFGRLNLLALPLVVYFLITVKKRERWEIALCLALCISCIFICFWGYVWPRYQLTIFPLLITIIFLFGWQVLRGMNRKVVFGIILICIYMLFGNYNSLKDSYAYYWRGSTGDGKPGERFPYKLIEYINKNVDDDSEIVGGYNQVILNYYASEKTKLRGPGKSKYMFMRSAGGALDNLADIEDQSIRRYGVAGYNLVYEDQGYKLYKKIDKIDLYKEEARIVQLYNNLYEPVLSKKSLVKNGSLENWQANNSLLPDFWHISGGGSVQKESNDKKFGKYAIKLTGDNFNFYQNVTLSGLAPGKEIICFAWLKSTVPDKYRIQIYDGIDSSFSTRHMGDGKWQLLRAIHTIKSKPISLEIRVVQAEKTNGLNDVVYVDGVLLFPGEYSRPYTLLIEQGHLMHSVIDESASR